MLSNCAGKNIRSKFLTDPVPARLTHCSGGNKQHRRQGNGPAVLHSFPTLLPPQQPLASVPPMLEEPIWKGSSSHWKNFSAYLLSSLTIPLSIWLNFSGKTGPWIYFLIAVGAIYAFWKWLKLITTSYQITNERLITTAGILTKVTDPLELYRVRDLQIVQPLWLRILKLHNIHIITTDASSAEVVMDYIPTSIELGEKLRASIEACRKVKGVRSLDITSEQAGDHPGADVAG